MSLFKTEEFWSTKSGQGEKYTNSTLCVGNFFSTSKSFDQIITGSLNGYLRMFSSSQKLESNEPIVDDDANPFSIVKSNSSLENSIEYFVKFPIIQLELGKFCSDSKNSLAVLNPNRLILLDVDEESMTFRIMEEFNLKRVAYNFCFGNFGCVSDRDFICVQSTDTTLSFFVNGHLSFSCFLSDYLIPGPIQYLKMDDSILIVNSNRYFEAYKYKNLAILNSKNTEMSSIKNQKRAIADWNFNLGEDALEIKICEIDSQGSLILVLCRYSIFIINARDRTALKKRFDCRCKFIIDYGLTNQNESKFLLINSLNELMVFRNTCLKWKASIIIPNIIDIKLGKFNDLKGFFVTLNEMGNIAILYLGTDPSTNTVLVPSTREIINDNNEEELISLQQKIKRLTSNNTTAPISIKNIDSSKSLLKLVVDYSSSSLKFPADSSPEYSLNIKLKSPIDVKNIVVRVSSQAPIIARQKLFHFSSLSTDKDVTCLLTFLANAAMVACSLRVLVYVTYETTDNLMKIGQTSLNLPLSLIMTSCSPCKQAKFKLTLDTTEEIVSLTKLFSEFPSRPGDEFAGVAAGFQYHNDGPVVTILASAATKRYRIQSDHFEAIWLVMKELSVRLGQHFGPNFRVKYSDPLPLESYFLVLDFHFSVRTNLTEFRQLLEERSKQFRAIEKLFLTKTKDKSLVSLENLDTLLENSLSQLMQLADLIIEQEQHLAIVGNALCSATSIVSFLLQISVEMPLAQQQLLQNAMSGNFRDFPEFGLEELYEQIFVFLLKSIAGTKAGKEIKLTVSTMEMPSSIDRLKKHLIMLCERVGKGVKLTAETPGDSGDFDDDDRASGVKKFVTGPHTTAKSKKSKKSKKVVVLE